MQKITIKELVNFRRKSDRSRKSFANKLKHREAKVKADNEVEAEGGGDYWVSSTSCIYNVFKYSNNDLYDSKVDDLRSKFEGAKDKRIKSMYQRNIDILTSFKEFDFNDLKPSNNLKFVNIPKAFKVVTLESFPLFVNPRLLFSYNKNGKNELGAVWLVPQLNGFTKDELGMFCEMLYRFVAENYAANHQISPDHCIAVDTYNAQKVTYADMLNGHVPFLIDKTLNEIKES